MQNRFSVSILVLPCNRSFSMIYKNIWYIQIPCITTICMVMQSDKSDRNWKGLQQKKVYSHIHALNTPLVHGRIDFETFTFVNPHYFIQSKIRGRGHIIFLYNVCHRNKFFMARYFTLFTEVVWVIYVEWLVRWQVTMMFLLVLILPRSVGLKCQKMNEDEMEICWKKSNCGKLILYYFSLPYGNTLLEWNVSDFTFFYSHSFKHTLMP